MTPNPIRKVLSTLAKHQVQYLLMGGQACVLYGAAEFSRDTDIAVLAERSNLCSLQLALNDLQAHCIAMPPFELDFLLRGHAVHFRCRHPEAEGIRIDAMARLRGVDPFPDLWARRTTLLLDDDQAFLWTAGYAPRLDTYLGPETPNPLLIRRQRGGRTRLSARVVLHGLQSCLRGTGV